MKTDHSDRRPAETNENDWVGAYGFGGHHGPGWEPQPGEDRDAWDRAADAFLALIGDEDAARRLRKDHMPASRRHGRDGNH
ncbi:hypothetical protein [Azospirillum sp. sgz301742]